MTRDQAMSAREDAVSAATAAYGDGGYGHAHRMNKAIAAYEAALSAAGWVVVPREPTEAMLQTFHDTVLIECYPYARTVSVLNDRATYRAMIAAGEATDDGR